MQVSIILTSYNYGQYLKDTVNSILNQTFKDWELIIVDDCSIDNSVDIIMEFVNSDMRIKFIRNYENIGLAKSIQTGLLAASGEWVAFLESDDLLTDDYLEKKLGAAVKYPHAGLIYNDVKFFGEEAGTSKEKYSSLIRKNKSGNFPADMFYNFGYENQILTMSSVMIKRELFDNIAFLSPIDKLFDWYLYIQLARKTNFYYIDEPLTLWRQHKGSYLVKKHRIKFRFANISAYWQVLKQEPLNIKLFLFILVSIVRMCFKRLAVYIKETVY